MSINSVKVHRCRFVDAMPQAVECVEFDPRGGRLAVLRANADIEVWCLALGGWFCESRLAGAADAPVRRVAWGAHDPAFPRGRLFTCGLHGMISEWDLCTLSSTASCDSYGGAAWSMAMHHASGLLAVGCEDGGISLIDTTDSLALVSRLPSLNERVLAVAFNPQGSHLACGTAGGVVCVWDVASRSVTSQVVLESFQTGSSARVRKPPLVWSVLLLSDMAVVAGDSSGHVTFVDGRHGTLVQSFGSHQADVLALAVSADQSNVFASGVDHKVALFSPAAEAAPTIIAGFALPAPPRRWLLSCSRRPHTHDVRALAVGDPEAGSGGGPVLVSAGTDTQLCTLQLHDFERCAPRKLLPLPIRGAYSIAPRRRLLLCQADQALQLWQLPHCSGATSLPTTLEAQSSTDGGEQVATDEPRQLLLLQPKQPQCNLRCSALAPDSQWMACSDSETRLYALALSPDPSPGNKLDPSESPIRVQRVPLPEEVPLASCMAFSDDSRLLLLGAISGVVVAVQLGSPTMHYDATVAVPTLHVLRPPALEGSADGKERRAALTQLALSPDGQWLAAFDAARHVRVFSLDSFQLTATVPCLASPPTAIGFSPSSDMLAIASANKQLTLFDVERGCLAPWSARNAVPLPAIAGRPEVVSRIVFNPARPDALVLCAQSWLCHVSLAETGGFGDGPARQPDTAGSDTDGAEGAAVPSTEGKRRRIGLESRKRKVDRRRQPGGSRYKPPKERAEGGGVAEESANSAAGAATAENGAAGTPSTPRRSARSAGAAACRMVTRYGPMLLFDFLAEDTALVLERPWLRVMESFPPTLHRARFGT